MRCSWAGTDPLYCEYHDTEWGVFVTDDKLLFEFLLLESFQAGLSWITILRKRENFRQAFDAFDAYKIAQYDDAKISELLSNKGIIRNKLKVTAAVKNAAIFLRLKEKCDSFHSYAMQFVNDQPIINHWKSSKDVPVFTKESDAFSKALKKEGMSFVGTTIIYSFMQATGMVMDHTLDCFRYAELS